MIKYFGPLYSVHKKYFGTLAPPQLLPFSAKMFAIFMEKWYHGKITGEDAENLLKNTNKGFYLMRCSSRSNGYTLSFTESDKQIAHVRVKLNRGVLEMILNGIIHLFEDEWDLIEYCSRTFELTRDCPGSKYYTKFMKEHVNFKYLNLVEGLPCKIEFNELHDIKQLYPGVLTAIWKEQLVSMKQIERILEQQDLDFLKRNTAVLMRMKRHRNVIDLQGLAYAPNSTYIITEYFDGTTLQECLKMPSLPVEKIAMGIAKGMRHLHQERFVHGDLNSSNVLLDKNLEVKITDFAMPYLKGTFSPNKWMSPETLLRSEIYMSSDVWSFGVLLMQLTTRKDPYSYYTSATVDLLKNFMAQNNLTIVPSSDFPLLNELMISCMQNDPNLRPSFNTICNKLSSE